MRGDGLIFLIIADFQTLTARPRSESESGGGASTDDDGAKVNPVGESRRSRCLCFEKSTTMFGGDKITADGATLTDLITPRPPQDVQKHRE